MCACTRVLVTMLLASGIVITKLSTFYLAFLRHVQIEFIATYMDMNDTVFYSMWNSARCCLYRDIKMATTPSN